MGVRIRRPSAFQCITKKEAKKGNIPEGDFKTKEALLTTIGLYGTKGLKLTFVTKKIREERSSKEEDRR
eukprot:2137846-Heterocapsa_arctica.AAC.1